MKKRGRHSRPGKDRHMKELQAFVDGYGFGISKEKLAVKAYRHMRDEGHDCYIINDRYIGVDGKEYQLIKSRKQNRWIVKEY